MINIVLFAFVLITTFAGCKENEPDPGPGSYRKVSKLVSSPTDFRTYEYNAAGLLLKYSSQWQNQPGSVLKNTRVMEYNGDRLVKSTAELGYIMYTYLDDLPSKAESFANNGRKISTMLFHFNDQKKLDEIIEEIAVPDGPEATRVRYQYHGDGNVRSMEFSYRFNPTEPFQITYLQEYITYDNKRNTEPAEALGNFFNEIVFCYNNPIRINNLDANGNLLGYNRYEYTYSADGLPIQKKAFTANAGVEQPSITFQYHY